jgi:hypothetical protein
MFDMSFKFVADPLRAAVPNNSYFTILTKCGKTITDQFRSEDLENIESGTYGNGIRRAVVVVVELFS